MHCSLTQTGTILQYFSGCLERVKLLFQADLETLIGDDEHGGH